MNNPVTGHAVTVKTADQYVIGWLPRYLVDVVYQGGGWMVQRSRGAGGAAEPRRVSQPPGVGGPQRTTAANNAVNGLPAAVSVD